MDVGETGHERLAVKSLELVETAAVDQTRDHLADIVGPAQIRRNNPVYLVGVVAWFLRRLDLDVHSFGSIEMGDDRPRQAQRMTVILGIVIGDTRAAGMDLGAAQFLRRHDLARRRFHQGWPAEKDGALPLDDDRLVGHGRHIGAAGRARSHHHGDLGNALRRHVGLIEEYPAEMIPVGKHLVLVRQVGAAGIDEINAR